MKQASLNQSNAHATIVVRVLSGVFKTNRARIKTITLCLLCAGLLNVAANAQKLSTLIPKKYTPSVAARVYDVVSKVPLDEAKQLQLANIYKDEDSIIGGALAVNADNNTLDRYRRQSRLKFMALFTPAELDNYYNALYAQQAYSITKSMAVAERSRLKGDSAMEKNLFGWYYQQYLEIERTNQKYLYDSTLSTRLTKVAVRYDSIFDKVFSVYSYKAYFNARTAHLDSIKRVNKTDKDKMQRLFINLCTKNKESSFADNYSEAMHSVITDTAYYGRLHRDEVNTKAKSNASRQIIDLTQKYQISKEARAKLLPVLLDKEQRLAVIDYAFNMETARKETLKNNTIAHFDSVVNTMLYREGKKTPNSLFFETVEQKNYLVLTDSQVDTLIKQGFEFDKMISKSISEKSKLNFDSLKYERDHVSKILTDEQYNKFLIVRNLKIAREFAMTDWQTVKENGVATQADSAKYFKQIENYQLARCVAVDRYQGDLAHRTANLKAIDRSRPDILWRLRTAQRTKKDTTSMAKGYVGTFQW